MDADVGLCLGSGTELGISLAVKEALRSHQQLLQNLYAELDEEREASATAASEALSMILRLQGEKAAVKMEADQYRRVAEERMCHAERSVEVFEDVVRQKDMEIASLEFQVLAYRYKLMSLGCSGDFAVGENRFLDNLFRQRFDLFGWGGKESGGANVRRMNSLPSQCSKDLHQMKDDDFLENRFGNPVKGDPEHFREQIKVMGGRVEELSDRYDSPCCPIISSTSKPDDAVTTKKAPGNATCAVSVHDVFEVPGIEGSCKGIGVSLRNGCVMSWDDRLGKPDSDPEACAGWIKAMLVSLDNDNVHAKSREITTCANDATLQEIRDVEIRDEVRALSDRVERLEKERSAGVEGIVCKQSMILKEIMEQLSLIKGEMRCERSKNDSPRQRHRQPSLFSLQEAMLHFWL